MQPPPHWIPSSVVGFVASPLSSAAFPMIVQRVPPPLIPSPPFWDAVLPDNVEPSLAVIPSLPLLDAVLPEIVEAKLLEIPSVPLLDAVLPEIVEPTEAKIPLLPFWDAAFPEMIAPMEAEIPPDRFQRTRRFVTAA